MVYLQTTYELCFGEAYFEYFESCDFSCENTNIDVSVFMFDLRIISMSSECEYDWYWKISTCSTEYEICDSFASLTRHQTSYSGPAGWYFRYQSIHIQITYTYRKYMVKIMWYLDLVPCKEEKCEDTKGVIRSRMSKKNIQYNGQKTTIYNTLHKCGSCGVTLVTNLGDTSWMRTGPNCDYDKHIHDRTTSEK